MGEKREFTFLSANGTTNIHCVEWKPSGKIKAILQISHGMVEFIERYEHFAEFLNNNEILVVGHDHLGHGNSIRYEDDYGYFAEPDPNGIVINDLHKLTEIVKEQYKDIPYFLLGHSMGSFYARQYLCEYGYELNGIIIMGTGGQPAYQARLGMNIAKIIAKKNGWRHRSPLLGKIIFGGYNRHFNKIETPKAWLTKDLNIIENYISDKRSQFSFTLNGYNSIFSAIDMLSRKEYLRLMPKRTPIFIVSGKDDPVGNYGKSVKKLVLTYKKVGMKNIRWKLYKDDRHEILNETDRDIVYKDILCWINKQLAN